MQAKPLNRFQPLLRAQRLIWGFSRVASKMRAQQIKALAHLHRLQVMLLLSNLLFEVEAHDLSQRRNKSEDIDIGERQLLMV